MVEVEGSRADGTPADAGVPDAWGGYPGGLTVTKGDQLFPRLRVD